MIEKIQNLIEDNTSMEITRNQVIMGLVVVGLLILFVIFLFIGSTGPQKDAANFTPPPPNSSATVQK